METELICFDFAGTTMDDDGLVLEAFRRTIADLNVPADEVEAAERYVRATMGQSKIDVFVALFSSRADQANTAFERHFLEVAHERGVAEIPGARDTVERLRDRGIDVALTTGFSPSTREALIEILGWNELFPVRVSPADAGRGRPAPDMLLVCALRQEVTAMDQVVTVGDTTSDMVAGRRAGVGACVGVLSGADDATQLFESGADVVLTSVVDLVAYIEAPRAASKEFAKNPE